MLRRIYFGLMYENVQMINYAKWISLIVIFGIIVGTVSVRTEISFVDQNVWGQMPPIPPTPPTTTTATAPNSSLNKVGVGQMIIQQGVITSSTDPLPGHEAHQSAPILHLREDNVVYAGTLTFTSTKPVEVQVLHRNMTITAINTKAVPSIPEEFGALSILQLPGNNGEVTISNIIPQLSEDATTFSATIPFSGNALALHNMEGEPFAATYTVTAGVVGTAYRADNIGPTPITSEDEEQSEEEDEDEDNDE